jgi:hypothetical protein
MHRKPTPAILSAVLAILLAACATSPGSPDTNLSGSSDTGAGAPTTVSDDVTGPLFDAGDIADSYSAPEDPPYDYRSLEQVEWLSFCTAAFGFESTIVTVPGARPTLIFPDAPAAQQERWVEVNEMCTAEGIERGWFTGIPSSPDELREEYRHLVAVNECLTELGYGTEPPSETRYLEERVWDIYANTPMGAQLVMATSDLAHATAIVRQQLEIQEQCPIWGPTE